MTVGWALQTTPSPPPGKHCGAARPGTNSARDRRRLPSLTANWPDLDGVITAGEHYVSHVSSYSYLPHSHILSNSHRGCKDMPARLVRDIERGRGE